MKKLAVIILTYNEEKNIEECIRSASFADEVVVVDSGSTDNTVAMAEGLGAKVHIHPFENFAAQRNVGLEQTDADWIFYLDADERISQEAAKDIRRATEENRQAFYDIKRVNIVFGQRMKYGGHGPDYPQRLYPRGHVKWEGVVHEGAITDLPLEHLKGELEHYPYDEWDKYFAKFNQYTTLMAEKMYTAGKRANMCNMFSHAFFGFFRFYFFKRGICEGKLGLILAVNHFFYTMTKYVKLYYLQKKEGK